jgi:hypothetical protein
VRDRFISRRSDAAGQIFGRVDGLLFHHGILSRGDLVLPSRDGLRTCWR